MIPHYTADSAAYPPPVDRTKYDAVLAKVTNLGNVGICGAHRTGKTTLARALSKRIGLPFVEIGASAIFAEYNLDPSQPLNIRTRLGVQRKILNHATMIWFSQNEPFICDRTPIDMMAYTLADVQGHSLTPQLEAELANYLYDCDEVAKELFSNFVLIPPAIPVIPAIGKASPSRGYINHIHLICLGLLHDLPVNGYMMDCQIKEINARVNDVVRFLNV